VHYDDHDVAVMEGDRICGPEIEVLGLNPRERLCQCEFS
jgi:hypothetical protein